MNVYLLWHIHELNEDYSLNDEEKLIGIYSTEEKASEAIEAHKDLDGFRDYPVECFEIHEVVVDRSDWNEALRRSAISSRIDILATEEHHNGINKSIPGFHIGSAFRAR